MRPLLVLCLMLVAGTAPAGEPRDPDGAVGRTSYRDLPFQQQVYRLCWKCSPDLEPAQLFFDANAASPFNDPAEMAKTAESVTSLEADGIVPSAGVQRWESTFAASFPDGSFAREPEWVGPDRARGFPKSPEFVAWRNWIAAHPRYEDVAADGGTMPPSFREWGSSWGFIAPFTPLDPADCPPDLAAGCNWGDLFAYRWALTSSRTGAYGLILSDFSDSLPGFPANRHDFNPAILALFAQQTGAALPPSSTPMPERARWIVTQAFDQWIDFAARGYAAFYAALAQRIGAATGKTALIIDQCGRTPAERRLYGTDQRIIAAVLAPDRYLCLWDNHVIQSDRGGPIAEPLIRELAGPVLAAAREPSVRNGANLEADDRAYWAAIDKFYPTLDAEARREVGLGLLRRLWIWSAWAHVADRTGTVRRALALASRDYWDEGSLSALDPLPRLIHTIVPTHPFGPALYYSVAAERAIERDEGRRVGTSDTELRPYLSAETLQTLVDGGAALGYFVSDAALDALGRSDDRPSAWIVPDTRGHLPAGERQKLEAIAPVVETAAELARLPGQTLRFSPGVAGFGFRDQTGRVVIVASNPSAAPDAKPVEGSATLAWPEGGTVDAQELLSGRNMTLTAADRSVVLPLTLGRWQTVVFALDHPRGSGK